MKINVLTTGNVEQAYDITCERLMNYLDKESFYPESMRDEHLQKLYTAISLVQFTSTKSASIHQILLMCARIAKAIVELNIFKRLSRHGANELLAFFMILMLLHQNDVQLKPNSDSDFSEIIQRLDQQATIKDIVKWLRSLM